ncbi:uncharacterized protein Dana_GF12594 [Drosophila ananassae]|uniref:Uncharacterized protein n=1 Tax=Drosophila ananassae TaxID=7217 RepID=B3MFZ6_DROAN|nr:uncharacterized protein LOC6495443 [Drosophila ananassae]EDV35678.2 uncharacterized protein Dana_GF12594 [Drosophila ananassae]
MNSSKALVCNCSRFSRCFKPVISRGMKQLRLDDMHYKPNSYRERVYQQTWSEQHMTEEPEEGPGQGGRRNESRGNRRTSSNKSARRSEREELQEQTTMEEEMSSGSQRDENRSSRTSGHASRGAKRGIDYATSASGAISDSAGTGASADSGPTATAHPFIKSLDPTRRLQKITVPASEFISKLLSDQRKNKMRHYEAEVFSDRIGQEGFYLV